MCDYSDAFILVTWDITLTAGNNTEFVFKRCAPLSTCKSEIHDVFVDEANHVSIAIPMYILIEYNDNFSNTSESLWQFQRDEVRNNNADLTSDNSQSFKYKAARVEKTADAVNNRNSFLKTRNLLFH